MLVHWEVVKLQLAFSVDGQPVQRVRERQRESERDRERARERINCIPQTQNKVSIYKQVKQWMKGARRFSGFHEFITRKGHFNIYKLSEVLGNGHISQGLTDLPSIQIRQKWSHLSNRSYNTLLPAICTLVSQVSAHSLQSHVTLGECKGLV